ncbi:MAG: hypothetical protein JXA22_00375 [Candidatus Thermoplasmatota archaeon]|nr:hypothetical protein [Candidatus Thermoplasmatota archaeon]
MSKSINPSQNNWVRGMQMLLMEQRSRSMYLVIGAMLVLYGLTIMHWEVSAHPPEDIELMYDYASQILNITITHTTPAPSQHYIGSVEVFRNNISVIEETYESQPTVRVFYLEFEVLAEDGDVLKVKAACNLWGELEEETIVEGPRERMYIEVNPKIEELEMGEERDLTVNIYEVSDDDPLEGVVVQVTAWLGTVTEVNDLGLGGYSFTYTAPELETEDIDVINISASKNGYHSTYHEFEIDILLPLDPDRIIEVTLSPRFTMIEEGESKEVTVIIEAGGSGLDVDDIKVDRSGGTYSTERSDVGVFMITFKASEVTTNQQGWLKVTAEMEGYRSGSAQMSFTIVDIGTPDDDDDTGVSNDKGLFNTTTIAISIIILVIIVGIVVFIIHQRRKKG